MGGNWSKAQAAYDFNPALRRIFTSDDDNLDDKPRPQILTKRDLRLSSDTVSDTPQFGRVVRAEDTSQGTTLMAKTFPVKKGPALDDLCTLLTHFVQVQDDHVLRVVGVLFTAKGITVAFQNCDGTLLDHLKAKAAKLSLFDKLDICVVLAEGMTAVDNARLVHSALAATNCWTAESGYVFKIGDPFTANKDIRRIAPELQIDGSLPSMASDVWAFGVLMLEIFMDGAAPFADLDDPTFTTLLKNKQSLPIPSTIRESVATVLKQCWNYDPASRPDFYWLRAELQDQRDRSKS